MRVPQVRSEWFDPAARRSLCDGAEHHTREDLFRAVVLASLLVHCLSSR